jgi:hypothetical protein
MCLALMNYASKGIALATLAILCGCAQHYTMPSPQYFSGQTVDIETWDGQWHTATPLPAEQGAAWDDGTGAPIPAMAVKTVLRSNVGRSVGKGTGFGALTGLVLGATMGFTSGDDQCQENEHNLCLFVFSAKDKAILLGLVMTGVGAGVGALLGLAAGRREVFESPPWRSYSLTLPDVAIVPLRGGAAGGLHWKF